MYFYITTSDLKKIFLTFFISKIKFDSVEIKFLKQFDLLILKRYVLILL